MEKHNINIVNSSYPPRKRKRTKFIRTNTAAAAATTSELVSSPYRPSGKPDPSAPKITRPCTECGRTFWSWKALFGHMRCHPERQWRGIVPPPNLRRLPPETTDDDSEEEDHEVASCLLMLANGPPLLRHAAAAASDDHTNTAYCALNNCGRFECSSCKKVFGSHQALGGHRASHKNVKGCYAITKSCDGDQEYDQGCCSSVDHINNNNHSNNGYKCSICFRVFTSGQALGGHMRCHWDNNNNNNNNNNKVEGSSSRVFGFDLNLAAQQLVDQDDGDDIDASFVCSWAPAGLNLELGL